MRFLNQIEKAHVNVPFHVIFWKVLKWLFFELYLGYLKPQTLDKSKIQQIMP
jgi:hypothetical protein